MEYQREILLIRHLPPQLTSNDKEELLKHFGATSVQCMSDCGPMKQSAFATFASECEAERALRRLHQLPVLGYRLVVEYARTQDSKKFSKVAVNYNTIQIKTANKPKKESAINRNIAGRGTKNIEMGMNKFCQTLQAVTPKWGLKYPLNPKLVYKYPEPNLVILKNICNALASVPKFYVQVLHLMNKMNFPSPFGKDTASPEVPEGTMDVESEESVESELESDEDEDKICRLQAVKWHNPPLPATHRPVKRMRLKEMQDLIEKGGKVSAASAVCAETLPPSLMFDQSMQQQQIDMAPLRKPIEFKFKPQADDSEGNLPVVEGGFGKIAPAQAPTAEDITGPTQQQPAEEGQFISFEELDRHRMTENDLKMLSVYKNYTAGEQTSRLYVKNLSKHVTKEDLEHIYGRFRHDGVDASEGGEGEFDIRLMQEGRMKGQAFVSLANKQLALDALQRTHGYILKEKPMIVQFARVRSEKS